MALTIILENENRESILTLNKEFEFNWIKDVNKFKLLCYLNAYGDAVFNQLQMEGLIRDLQQLKLSITDPLIDEIIILAKRCKVEAHTYLVFHGD